MQYFATEPNNGVFGPASKLVALSTERPASATARPLSATGRASRAESGRTSALETGRTSRTADEPARRRLSSMPRPSPAPRRSVGGRTALSPQKSTPRTTPTRRPPSTLPPLPPASFSQDDSFVFDEPPPRPPTAAPDDLLEQLALPSAAPLAEARRELAEARAASAEQRARAAERELELEETRRRELADEARRREALEQRVAELQRQLTEALDTATSAADAHEALEQRAAAHGERVLDLEAALAAAQLRDEHRPDDESDASRELALLHTRIEQMMTAWNRERSELVERIDELEGAGRETISVVEQQLAAAAAGEDTLRMRVRELEAQLDATQDKSVTAAEIDNASLREQLAHLEDKAQALEDELSEARVAAELAAGARSTADAELADTLRTARDDAARCSADADAARAEAAAARAALDECRAALERAHAEMEALREAPRAVPVASPRLTAPSFAPENEASDAEVLRERIAQLEREAEEQRTRHAKELAELESLVESRIFRENELETELEQLKAAR